MSTDFFDDDLIKASNARPGDSDDNDAIQIQPILGATLGKMARKKEEMTNQAANAAQEIERLKMRQEELEREKNVLEDLSRKQDQYDHDKSDIIEKLDRSLVAMEREESQAARMVELLSEARARFKSALADIRAINEDLWGDHNFCDELNRASALIENTRLDYKKSLAKIEAVNMHSGVGDASNKSALDAMGFETGGEKDFGYWVKVGFAVTLPLMAVLLVAVVMYLLLHKG